MINIHNNFKLMQKYDRKSYSLRITKLQEQHFKCFSIIFLILSISKISKILIIPSHISQNPHSIPELQTNSLPRTPTQIHNQNTSFKTKFQNPKSILTKSQKIIKKAKYAH
jgi:hypothetical protein